MDQFNDDDYLLEITFRVAVRKQDAAALLSQTASSFDDDSSEENRVFDVVSELFEGAIDDHDYLHYSASSVGRLPSFEVFDNFCLPGSL
jgi:hypothetical protein